MNFVLRLALAASIAITLVPAKSMKKLASDLRLADPEATLDVIVTFHSDPEE